MSIQDRLLAISQELGKEKTLVAVSETKPIEDILEAYQCGQRIFGENKVQELVENYEQLPKDIQWHLIGHLQSNKVKYIAPFVALIHSVDSLKLLLEIDKQALKNHRCIDCLLQFHVATEETKFGMTLIEARELLGSSEFQSLKNVRIVGVMGMASFTDDKSLIHQEFQTLKSYLNELKNNEFKDLNSFKEISMGMSSDYQIALDEGSNMIRLGSTIFGQR